MKKIIIFLAIIIAVVSIIGVKYYSYVVEHNAIIEENAEYEQYENQEIYGLEIGTIINKIVDRNTKNNIQKDEKGMFIEDEDSSIKMTISVKREEEMVQIPIEAIYKSGTEQFIQYYKDIKFKCSKIEYHDKTGKIKSLLFEQI